MVCAVNIHRLLFHLMSREKSMLVDVVALSTAKCSAPIQAELKYATKKNFTGSIIAGYDPMAKDFALMSPAAANKLCDVQNYLLEKHGYGLKIFDAYRPKRAVNYLMFWAKKPAQNAYEIERKEKHYPDIEKNKLFDLGYVAEDSGHCYGNTVDLILVNMSTGKKVSMGTRFDYMNEKSHITATADVIGTDALFNRNILAQAMYKFGFEPYPKEYWHFSHGGIKGRENETPLDIPITPEMKGLLL